MTSANNQVKSPQELLEAKKAREAAEKAELKQALMSLYIPLTLFISCCIFAAGAFMVYYEEPAGWAFIGVTVLLALSAFIGLFKFQNKFRAKGIIPTKDTVVESNVLDASPDASIGPALAQPGLTVIGQSARGEGPEPGQTKAGAEGELSLAQPAAPTVKAK
jgi:hypothetical protein